jgi:thiopurine S-methyltransferase
MDAEFWLERWQSGSTHWHEGRENRMLARFVDRLGLDDRPGAVFLPLCGKAHDMAWLAERGYQVIGIDISEIAAKEFFEGIGVTPRVTREGELWRYSASGITFFVGDVFALGSGQLADVTAVFDRGALVALTPAQRSRYVDHLSRVLPGSVTTLLVVVEYDDSVMSGPPFSVTEDEVQALYEARTEIDLLMRRDILEEEPRFRERGLRSMAETAYLLRS